MLQAEHALCDVLLGSDSRKPRRPSSATFPERVAWLLCELRPSRRRRTSRDREPRSKLVARQMREDVHRKKESRGCGFLPCRLRQTEQVRRALVEGSESVREIRPVRSTRLRSKARWGEPFEVDFLPHSSTHVVLQTSTGRHSHREKSLPTFGTLEEGDSDSERGAAPPFDRLSTLDASIENGKLGRATLRFSCCEPALVVFGPAQPRVPHDQLDFLSVGRQSSRHSSHRTQCFFELLHVHPKSLGRWTSKSGWTVLDRLLRRGESHSAILTQSWQHGVVSRRVREPGRSERTGGSEKMKNARSALAPLSDSTHHVSPISPKPARVQGMSILPQYQTDAVDRKVGATGFSRGTLLPPRSISTLGLWVSAELPR